MEELPWTDPESRHRGISSILARAVGQAEFRIIFICGGNICRSPFAEMKFEKVLGDRCGSAPSNIIISSGGFISNKIIHEFTRRALLEAGVPAERVDAFSPRHMRKHKDELDSVDLILVPTRSIIETLLPRRYWNKAFLFSEVDGGVQVDIEDPALLKEYEPYHDVMVQIDRYLDILATRLVDAGACRP